MTVAELKDIYTPGGMTMVPLYSVDGGPAVGFAVFEVIERFEKHTEDRSDLYYFPHVSVYQRALIQEWRGSSPNDLVIHGDPSMQWLLVPEESRSLPFVPRDRP